MNQEKTMKVNNHLSVRLGLGLSVMILMFAGPGLRAENLTVTLEAGEYRIADADGGRQLVTMDDFGKLLIPGKPMLPAKNFMIAVPPGAEVVSVNVNGNGPIELEGVYAIAAAPPHLPSDNRKDVIEKCREEFRRNYSMVYSSDRVFPESAGEFTGKGRLRKYSFVRVAYFPLSYRPQSGRLVLYPSLVVSIEYNVPASNPKSMEAMLRDRVGDERASGLFVNYDQAKAWYRPAQALKSEGDDNPGFMIIGTDAMWSAAAALSLRRDSMGYRSIHGSVDNINATYPGADAAERIRNFLIDNYIAESIEYVLLVGDIDVIPMRICYPDPTNHDPYSSYCPPTDYYYADLTSDWDADGDGYPGELDEDSVDFVPEVIVGRIPFNDTAVVRAICQKLIAFESDTSSWKKNALLLGAVSNYENGDHSGLPGTDGAVLMEMMIDSMLDGWSYTTMYEKEGIDASTYACDYPLTAANAVNDWASNDYGIVNWWAHGSVDAAWRMWWSWDDGDDVPESGEMGWEPFFYNADTAMLDDDHPSIVFSCSCNNAWPEADNLAKNLLAHGSAGVVASTRVSWFIEGWGVDTSGGNASIDYHFFDYLINSEEKVGDALYDSKVYYFNNLFWGGYDYDWSPQENMLDFCLYGDPALVYEGVVLTCCGMYTGGYTGNTNCDTEGKLNLTDITTLISRIYISPEIALCCEPNGDVNCDCKLNLADITKLIDFRYITPTNQPCHCSERTHCQ
jgi:hypothetical protein